MSPLLEYAFYGTLAGLGLIAANLAVVWARRALRRHVALKRVASTYAPGAEPVSLRRKKAVDLREDRTLLDEALGNLQRLWLQSGGEFQPVVLGAAAAVSAIAGALLTYRGLGDVALALIVGCALAAFTPWAMLTWARDKRRHAFVLNLPAAMDVLIRSLRAGHPLTVAISLVGRDMPDPVGAEFRLCSQEMAFGLDLETAIDNVAERVGVAEANVLASAISIQQRSGGNLTEVLQRLATLLRDRTKLKAKARALTAEGRFSGLFLSVMPFIMFGLLAITTPSYYGGVDANPLVAPVLFGTIVWMSIGVFIIHRLVNFKP